MSAGHGSSIYYAILHAFGYGISMDDLKNFRKIGSITPGHPEYGLVPGVDATTGPLGQGVSMAVGMAMAQKFMANKFNKPDLTLFDNYTYTLVGEGCLMEGVSYESLALAGTLKLNKLIVLYDCNKTTLDSSISGVMDQNILNYMKSLGYNTLEVEDGNSVDQISQAILLAKQSKDKPSFIKVNTHIGFGSVFQDSNKAHGAVLGAENVKLLREKLGIKTLPFELDKNVLRDLQFLRKRFDAVNKVFKERLKVYAKAYPGDFKLLKNYLSTDYTNVFKILDEIKLNQDCSGRDMGQIVLNKLAENYPNIVTGSADVSGSTKTLINSSGFMNDNFANRNIKFGIREFAMGCIANGMSLYGGITPIVGTFLVFSDYMKPSIRLGSLMEQKTITVFTHDSIAVGEDGATHQSCEHMWALREIPNMRVFRPCNMTEVKSAYAMALNYSYCSSIVLSRQLLKNFDSDINGANKGGYIIAKESGRQLNGIIIATGSEIELALNVKRELDKLGYNLRVVSMPCIDLFEEQTEKYRESVIPSQVKSVFTIEAGSTSGWYKFAGKYGKCFGVDAFGASGNYLDIYKKFGLTTENISKEIIKIIKSNREKRLSLYES